MQIVDIQPIEGIREEFELTFADDEGYDFLVIKLSKNDMQYIVEYYRDNLGYGAQLKKKKL